MPVIVSVKPESLPPNASPSPASIGDNASSRLGTMAAADSGFFAGLAAGFGDCAGLAAGAFLAGGAVFCFGAGCGSALAAGFGSGFGALAAGFGSGLGAGAAWPLTLNAESGASR